MDLIDSKYIGLVSTRLEKFKKVKVDLYNFRCPLCGDSKRNKNRTRGYFYAIKTNTNFKCHNCGASLSFNNFLKEIDPSLHQQYTFEKFKEGFTGRNFVVEEPQFNFKKPVFKKGLNLPRASEVQIAKEYLEKRKINSNNFYYADKFKEWVNTLKKTFQKITYDESRIIIPLYGFENELIGIQGRSLDSNSKSVKYITVMLDENAPKVYGLEKVDISKPIYIVEGPFDSTFIKNSVAMCGSDVDIGSFNWSNYIYVFDNEPRNREIVNRISKTIDKGDKVVIWPSNVIKKDINELIMEGVTENEILKIIKNNTYCGAIAKLKLNQWKKC